MEKDWFVHKKDFLVKDVRGLQGNFLPSILKLAEETKEGSGFCIIQSFEPIPLYSTLSALGYEHQSEKISEEEWRVYFYRQHAFSQDMQSNEALPLKPIAILNFAKIDSRLANIVVNFWQLIWQDETAVLPTKTRLLISLANGIGAGRIRQATRELIKAYAIGVSIKELDELFSMIVWNQGVGFFASEVGPSTLFAAYSYAKREEEKGKDKGEIAKALIEKFGETNPNVGVTPKS